MSGRPPVEHLHPNRGDVELARRLLFEHGRRPTLAGVIDPELIECLAATGRLAGADLWLLDRQWRGEQLVSG